MYTRADLSKRLLSLSFSAIVAVAVILYALGSRDKHLEEVVLYYVPAVVCAVGVLAVPFTKTRPAYYVAQGLITICYLGATSAAAGMLPVEVLLLTAVLSQLALFEPFPSNLIETLSLVAVAFVLRVVRLPHDGGLTGLVDLHLPFLVFGLAVSVFGSLMVRHRELLVTLSASHRHLMNSTVNLARANTLYQDYAVGARELAAEAERRRIARDIHDVVGYTLTNNMMLMEAAQDLIKENPLSIPAILETARANAQEGLQQVRAAMYKLLERDSKPPVGLNAVGRLARVFEQATGIRITCDFANMPATVNDDIDSAVYHMIQEALVNSFRHGQATEVRVSFWCEGQAIELRIEDNGTGASRIVEGIGLRGMRERIEALGGSIRAGSGPSGFSIMAAVPIEGARPACDDDTPLAGPPDLEQGA